MRTMDKAVELSSQKKMYCWYRGELPEKKIRKLHKKELSKRRRRELKKRCYE